MKNPYILGLICPHTCKCKTHLFYYVYGADFMMYHSLVK